MSLRLSFLDGVDPAEGGSRDIVQNRHPGQGFDHLEGPTDPEVTDFVGLEALDARAFEQDIAGGDGKEV